MKRKIDRCRLRIGFISTRFAGTDGVSLETEKWAHVLEEMGHCCFYFAGQCDRSAEISYVVPEAFFRHPEINAIHDILFQENRRPIEITNKIYKFKDFLKNHLYLFIAKYDIDLLIVENAISIPVNVPLGVAITELIAETGFSTIAHHHDLYWERKRFLSNCAWEFLTMAFPPLIPTIKHVVINSMTGSQLSYRTGISSRLIPNVMDFDHPPTQPDEYSSSLRNDLKLRPEEKLILQPTRIVQRKGIEHAIELVSRLDIPAKLVISHAAGDEGREYEKRIRDYSRRLGVSTLFISDIIQQHRGYTADGRKIYTLADAYPHADMVTYPSEIEGFGNAFLEAVYYRRPIVVNRYSIYEIDIKPKGFDAIEFDGFITEESVQKARKALMDGVIVQEMVEKNYHIARSYYSYSNLRRHLQTMISEFFGE
jgi:mannosylglucosylglycerate synthase